MSNKKTLVGLVILLFLAGCQADQSEPVEQSGQPEQTESAAGQDQEQPDALPATGAEQEWYDYEAYLLTEDEVPAGYELWHYSTISGGRLDDGFMRMEQVMAMPEKDKFTGSVLLMMIQTLVTDKQTLLDTFLTERTAGDCPRLHTIESDPADDMYAMCNPAAYLRTAGAAILVYSGRMTDEQSCGLMDWPEDGSFPDCSATITLNADELAVLQALEDKHLPLTGEVTKRWEWSYTR